MPLTRHSKRGDIGMLAAALRGLTVLVLVVLTLLPAGCQRAGGSEAPKAMVAPSRPAGLLQEVAPPGAAQQLQERLAQRQPRVTILSPAPDSLLPAGPWELVIAVDDWPLVQVGEEEWGPHLVVQLDGQAPIRVASGDARPVHIPMAALTPGSHRLTAFAARPWGEAVKDPGASTQIRLHRVAANPMALPEPGSPQLISVAPTRATAGEPALIDWMLLDAPLQHLREGDDRWRLRITVNGDSFLLDQNTPLWLGGLKTGSNAVVLELLDHLGHPLNPPFNTLVEEVVLEPGRASGWQQENQSPADLDRWLGLSSETPAAAPVPEPQASPRESAIPLEPSSPLESMTPREPPVPAAPPEALQAEEQQKPLESVEPVPLPSPASNPEATAQADIQPPGIEALEEGAQAPRAAAPEMPVPAISVPEAPPAQPRAAQGPAPVRARDLVNQDGSLVKARPAGLLDRVRAKFGG